MFVQSTIGLDGCLPNTSANGYTTPGPKPMNCTNSGEPYAFHTGGINVGLVDGSVRFMRESTSMRVFAAMVTAKGGEVIQEN